MSEDERFATAVKLVRQLPKSGPVYVSDVDKLKFYSLYKQATEGDNTATKPVFWDIVGRLKWDAWNEKSGMSYGEAREEYVELLRSHLRKLLESDQAEELVYDTDLSFAEGIPRDELYALFGDMTVPSRTDLHVKLLKKN